MIDDVSGGYLGISAVETAGFKMIDVGTASILSNEFSITSYFINVLNLLTHRQGTLLFGFDALKTAVFRSHCFQILLKCF